MAKLDFCFLVLGTLLALLAATIEGANIHRRHGKRDKDDGHWVDIWATMPQLTESTNLPPPPFNATGSAGAVFFNSTIRQTIFLTQPSSKIRLRLSNAFGVNDLVITAATVALPFNGSSGVSAIQPKTLQKVTFSGSESFTIPDGSLAVSDPIEMNVAAQSELAITLYLANGQAGNLITSHPGSRATSWFVFGNEVAATNLSVTNPSTESVQHWYFISAVEAWVPRATRAFAIVGDSITDGRESTTDGNNRWPDNLLARMLKNKATSNIAVLNQAAGGNRILLDSLGPNAEGRIDRDVLAHSGVAYAMIFEGVNDIGVAAPDVASQQTVGDRLILSYQQIATRIHAFEIPFFAATITPFSGDPTIQPYSNPERERTRQRVNQFIRTTDIFDEVLDFDAVIRDPNNHSMLNPLFDSGDFLHPNVAGYHLLADSIPLSIFNDD